MSATLSREMALQYASAQHSKLLLEVRMASPPGHTGSRHLELTLRAARPFPCSLQLDCGAFGCGADLSWLSQYPSEREVVFAPMTGVEVDSTRVEGDLVIARLRITVNHTSLPVEKVARKRLYAHLQLVDLLEGDLRQASAPMKAVLQLC